jgi:hypothetical protein
MNTTFGLGPAADAVVAVARAAEAIARRAAIGRTRLRLFMVPDPFYVLVFVGRGR